MSIHVVGEHLEAERLKESCARFAEKQEINRLISMRINKFMHNAEVVCKRLCQEVGSQCLTFSAEDRFLIISNKLRTLTIVPAVGFASDARLECPRGMYCGQVLIYGHLADQAETHLLNELRVYADGTWFDGVDHWKLDEHPSQLIQCFSGLIKHHLLEADVYWPSRDEQPVSMQMLSLKDNRIDPASLQQPCIGFECSLKSKSAALESSGR